MRKSYFRKAVDGDYGEDIQKIYLEKADEAVKDANLNAYVEEDGAIVWFESGNYVPDDFCEMLEYTNYNFSREATAKKRKIQTEKSIEEYKNLEHKFSDEELAEMRSAFGSGETIVDIITGEKIKL